MRGEYAEAALRLKDDALRAFVLACALEPLADKPGCTTRFVDSSPGTRLEYFTISAVNSGPALLAIVDRTLAEGRQPGCVFDLAVGAQAESTRNRLGGKVNYAQILMLLPLILAQALLFLEGRKTPTAAEIVRRASDAMRATSEADVLHLQNLVDLSSAQSAAHNIRISLARKQLAPRFVGACRNVMDATHVRDFSHTMMATEMRDSYPVCLRVYDHLRAHEGAGVLKRSEIVYRELLQEVLRPDVVADCIVVGLYLMIVLHPDETLFP